MNSNSSSSLEKCACDEAESTQDSDSSNNAESPAAKEKKSKISLTSLGFNLRRGRSSHFSSKRTKKDQNSPTNETSSSSSSSGLTLNTAIKKFPKWGIKFNCAKREPKSLMNHENQNCCRCTCYKRKDEEEAGECSQVEKEEVNTSDFNQYDSGSNSEEVLVESINREQEANFNAVEEREDGNLGIYGTNCLTLHANVFNAQFFDVRSIRPIHEDCDDLARMQRAREMEQGVEPPANFRQVRRVQVLCSDVDSDGGQGPRRLQLVCSSDVAVDSLRALFLNPNVTVRTCPIDTYAGCHTQVDFLHCLVPNLLDITNCSFYWGKMDRYEAERLLDGKPEGTFLLRDSAQEEFLFSVSFRKYGRSLHARIEQWNHKFSFDSHDPNVYTSDTVCGLIEHYKDPSSCMFFEPMLTRPLHRNFTFPLQHLCRANIVGRLTYDDINHLQLPKSLKGYLKEYHYRQKVRVERFDDDMEWLEFRKAKN